jgi:DNA-binding MarR family transcriptional regulator
MCIYRRQSLSESSRSRAARRNSSSDRAVSHLEAHLGYWLRFVSNHVSQGFQRKVEAAGVTVSEWVILRELLRLGSTSPTALCDAIGMTKGAVSKLISRLEHKQLITRTSGSDDRRTQTIELTRAGKTLVPKLARLADDNDEEFFACLSAQARADLVGALRTLVKVHQFKSKPVD